MRPRGPGRDWTAEPASGLALAGFLVLVFLGFTVLAMGPLKGLDAYFNVTRPAAAWLPVLHVADRIGQRVVCLSILGISAVVACRRQRSWRPALVAVLSVLALNFAVGVAKLGLGRAAPATGDPSFFAGGMSYPSGHAANMVLVYGLAVYLLATYTTLSRRAVSALSGVVVVLSGIMVFTSLTEDWHWFTDLIGGLVVGAAVLQLTASCDRMVTADVYDERLGALRPALRGLLRWRRRTAVLHLGRSAPR